MHPFNVKNRQLKHTSTVAPLKSALTELDKKKLKPKKPILKRVLFGFCKAMRKCLCEYPARLLKWVEDKIRHLLFGFAKEK